MDWEPAHADHAIDSVSAIITFQDAVDANTFDEIVVSVRKAAAQFQLTNRVDSNEPVMPNQTSMQPGQMVVDFGGITLRRRVSFQRLVENRPITELSIGMQNFVLNTSRYGRWSTFQEMLVSLAKSVEACFPLPHSVKSIQLQYIDRFDSNLVQADFFQVISRNSPFVPSALTNQTRALHAHSGWFDYTGPDERILTNVNLDVVDNSAPVAPEAKTKLTILTFARLEALSGTLQDPFKRLDGLHDYLKDVFGKTITEEASARVGLKD